MTPSSLHALFERLFGDADNVAKDAIQACQAAQLATGLDRGESDTLDVAQLAAYLDGGLDEAAQQDIHVRLSQSPTAFHDAASADAFLDAVRAAKETAPADLAAFAMSGGQPIGVSEASPRRPFPIWKWSGVAVAMAVAALAAFVIVSRTSPPTDTIQPMTAKSVPASADSPRLAQPQPRQGESKPPVVAGKETAPTYLAPAASEETMPGRPPQSR